MTPPSEVVPAAVPNARPVALAPGVTRDYLLHHRLCPVEWADDGALVIAAAPEALRIGLDELAFAYSCHAITRETADADVVRHIERLTTNAERTIELARAAGSDDDLASDVRD